MIQSLVMNDRMPGPPNPQLPSGGHFTMETLATMMLSIDKRLRLQENQNNIVNQETIYPTTYIRGNGPSTPEEQLTTNSVAKVWPDQPVESQGVDGDTNEPASAIDTKNM
jgi:hypothetical protein